jgi:sigma-B regulation protein RsbU (phosphoserine phosphatase)
MSRVPLRVSVPVFMAASVLIVALVLVTVSQYQARTTARELTRQGLEHVHERITTRLDALLSTPGKVNAINRSLVREGLLPLDDLSAARHTLMAELNAHPRLSLVALGTADGRATWVIRYRQDHSRTFYALSPREDPGRITEYRIDEQGVIAAEPTKTYAYDARTRPWFRTPVEAGRAAWSDPYLFVGGTEAEEATLGISYSEPILDDAGRLLGVVDAELTLAHISHYLEDLRIGDAGQVYVADHEGRLLGTSVGVALADDAGDLRPATSIEQGAIRTSARHVEEALGSFAALEATHVRTIAIDDQRTLLMATPYEHPTGLSWVIVTLIPESDFLGHLSATRRRGLIISVVAAAIVLALGIVMAVLMVRPIEQLTDHVRHIGEGELDREIHLSQSPELVRLSAEMNEMAAGLRDRMRIRRSLAVAMEVQQALLPKDSPEVEGLDVAGHSTYCDETGGDYYDFLDLSGLDGQSLCVALGDVMGHGVAAAMLMATARGILRSRTQESGSLADLLTHMNQLLVHDTGGTRFMTMLLATLDQEGRALRWASAGHDPPFCYDPASGRFVELEGTGMPLGILEEEAYEEHTFTDVRAGQVFFMATDGVWEMQSPDGEQFGKQRVNDLIAAHHDESAEAIRQHILRALLGFRGDDSQDDDVTFVIVKVR